MPRSTTGNTYRFRLEGTDHVIELPSVTHIIETVYRAQGTSLAWWGFKLGVHSQHPELPPEDVEEIYREAKRSSYSPFAQRDAAADRGSTAHALLEGLATGALKPEECSPTTSYERGVLSWWQERSPRYGAVLRAEAPVWSLSMGYAGTLDLLFQGPGYTLIDLKTRASAAADAKPAYLTDLLQVTAYRLAAQEMGYGGPIATVVVIVDQEGCWREDYRNLPAEAWYHTMRLYRIIKEVD